MMVSQQSGEPILPLSSFRSLHHKPLYLAAHFCTGQQVIQVIMCHTIIGSHTKVLWHVLATIVKLSSDPLKLQPPPPPISEGHNDPLNYIGPHGILVRLSTLQGRHKAHPLYSVLADHLTVPQQGPSCLCSDSTATYYQCGNMSGHHTSSRQPHSSHD